MAQKGELFFYLLFIIKCVSFICASNNQFRDQFCVDPRTMKKHAAYTEWADAYSCTRHRCQPSGKALAMFTVGCQMVTVPEYAIECEEVIEDTNMQFPYCCIRLRCLVVVHGEVWTRLIGQPWENLPAAPWSHMYKMKKPPPVSEKMNKEAAGGPVYQLGPSVSTGTELRSEKNNEASQRTLNKADVRFERSHCERGDPEVIIEVDPNGKYDQMFDYNQKAPKNSVESTLQNYMEEYDPSRSRIMEHRHSEEPDQHFDNIDYKHIDDIKLQTGQDMIGINTWSTSGHSSLMKPPLSSSTQDLHNMVATMGHRMNTIEQVIHKISDAMDIIKTDNIKASNVMNYRSPKLTKLDSPLRDMRPNNKIAPVYRSLNKDKKLTPKIKDRKMNTPSDPFLSKSETGVASRTQKPKSAPQRKHIQEFVETGKTKDSKSLFKLRKSRNNTSDERKFGLTNAKSKKTLGSDYVEIEDYVSNESFSDG